MKLIKLILWGLYALACPRGALRSIGEDEEYQVQKLKRDMSYYNLGARK